MQNPNFLNADPDHRITSIIDLWKYMMLNKGKLVPYEVPQSLLFKSCVSVPSFTQNAQQDAHEFISTVICNICNMADNVKNNFNTVSSLSCTTCKHSFKLPQEESHVLFFRLEKAISVLSVQAVLDNHFSICEEQRIDCVNCKSKTLHKIKKDIVSFPDTFTVVLGRYLSSSS